MPKYDFNKIALQRNFIEIALRHRCSPVNLQIQKSRNCSKNVTKISQ